MEFKDVWVKQKNWNENIAAILASFCRLNGLEITSKTILERYSGKEKMAHFSEITRFCNEWNIKSIQFNLVKEHLDQQFFPAFVLMKAYRTQLLMYAEGDFVYFVDSLSGWGKETKADFIARSMGVIIMLDTSEYKPEENYQQFRFEEEKSIQLKERTWSKPQIVQLSTEDVIGTLPAYLKESN